MSERATLWSRLRRSRVALIAALAAVVATPLWLLHIFPFLWNRQMMLMRGAVEGRMPANLASEEALSQAIFEQAAMNFGLWLAPIGVGLAALLFLFLRLFAKSDYL